METEALSARVWDLPPNHKAHPPSALLCVALSCLLLVPFPHVALPVRSLWHVLSVLVSYLCPFVSKLRFAKEYKPVLFAMPLLC